jgi:hypothetical protein
MGLMMTKANCMIIGLSLLGCSLGAMDRDGLTMEEKLVIGRRMERLVPDNATLWKENNRRELRIWDENNKRELARERRLDTELLKLESALLIKNLSHL